MNSIKKHNRFLLAATAALFTTNQAAHAVDSTVSTTGTWSASTWSAGVPNAIGDAARKTAASDITTTQNVVGLTLGTLDLGGSTNNSWTLTLSNSITLNQDGAGAGTATISNTNSSATSTNRLIIGTGSLVLADDLTITNSGGSTATQANGAIAIAAVISGTGNVTYNNTGSNDSNGAGGIRLTGINTYVGSSTISAGVVTFNVSNPFSTGTLNLGVTSGNSVTVLTTNSGRTLGNSGITVAALGGGNTAVLGATTTGSFTVSGTVLLNGGLTVRSETTSTNAVIFTNAISGVGGLTTMTPAITGSNLVRLTSASNTYSGATTIGAFTTLQAGVNNALPFGAGKGNLVIDGGATGASTFDLNNFDVNINGLSGVTGTVLGKVLNNGAAAKTLTVGNGDATASFAGVIGNGVSAVALTKSGTGTQTLSGNSTYTGATNVNAGTLILSGNNTSATGGTTISGGFLQANNANALTGTSFISFAGGTLQWGSGVTTDLSTKFANGAATSAYRLDTNGNNVNWASNKGNNTTAASSLTKLGAGTLNITAIANTWLGATTIDGGTVQVAALANGGTNSSIGAGSTSAADLVFGGGTLRYAGSSAQSTDRLFTIGDAAGQTATIDASGTGSGTMSFTGTGEIATGGSGARTLTLTGSNTGANTLAAVLKNGPTSATSLVKSGAGNWVLTGTCTYTGITSINVGTLAINGDNSGATGAVTVAAGITNETAVRLKGNGIIGGATSFAADPDGAGSQVGGIHSVGNSVGMQTFNNTLTYNTGSIFEWELGSTPKETSGGGIRGTDYDAVNVTNGQSSLLGSNAIFRVVLAGTQDFDNAFWTQDRQWTDIFKTADAGSNLNIASNFSSFQFYNYSGVDGALADIGNTNTTGRSFSISGNTLSWSAVPEPSSALAGLLLGAGLLRRRRR